MHILAATRVGFKCFGLLLWGLRVPTPVIRKGFKQKDRLESVALLVFTWVLRV